MNRTDKFVCAGLFSALAVAVPTARAQIAPPPPAITAPQGSLPTKQEANPDVPQGSRERARASVNENGGFQPGPCSISDSNLKVSISQVQFTGLGGGNGEPLAPEIVRLLQGIGSELGKPGAAPATIKLVCELRDEANFRLRRARYVAAVQIPQQTIDNGVLRLEVISGKIVDVHVHGDAGPFEKLILSKIAALKRLSPLNAADAERILLEANDIPGLSIQMGLSPATYNAKPGDLIGDMKISYRRFSVIGNVQNYNSSLLGRETVYARIEAYDLLGLNDRAYIAGSTTFDFKKQRTIQAGEDITLDAQGDHLSLAGTVAESRPALPSLDLRTVSEIGSVAVDHPLLRSLSANARLTAGFEFAQQRTKVYLADVGTPLNLDRVSTFFMRVDGDTRFLRADDSRLALLSGSLELRKGADIFGATKSGQTVGGYSPSRFYGSSVPFIVRGNISGVLDIGSFVELASTAQGQWANRELLNYDEFALGSLTIGRGYDPGANTGDRALASANEFRLNKPLTPRTTAQFYGFFDWVHLWNLDPFTTAPSTIQRSVGAGVRLIMTSGLKLDFTYARPLDPPILGVNNKQTAPARFMFSLTAQLFPFGIKF
ncbi:ShlB/FhaC/HecB family hemolysin secretion/activation protein [Novosphingobium sp.]|uniref:ShlB/FhaC/HecB family hemolysin secretion/activation protein n=1 Tax=Novosphingobium sp. TaxID=1874826 RepID=UPI003B51D092